MPLFKILCYLQYIDFISFLLRLKLNLSFKVVMPFLFEICVDTLLFVVFEPAPKFLLQRYGLVITLE